LLPLMTSTANLPVVSLYARPIINSACPTRADIVGDPPTSLLPAERLPVDPPALPERDARSPEESPCYKVDKKLL
jgi:hypothetical protein